MAKQKEAAPELNFYLPDFYYFYNLNVYIIELLQKNPELFYDGVKIKAVYGTFPGAYWNGGRVMHGITDRLNVEKTIAGINDLGVSIRYTFTNVFADEKLINDPYCNMLMEVANNGQNEVLVNNQVLETYLRETYPNFNYISSTTKCIMGIKEFNKECSKYPIAVMDFRKNSDKDFLEKISKPDKVELLVNAYCSPECTKRKEHYEYLSKCQLNGDTPTPFCSILTHSFFDCLKLNSTILLDDLFGWFIPHGFKHFKIEGRTLHKMDALESYMYYLIKPEYKDEVRYNAIKSLWY